MLTDVEFLSKSQAEQLVVGSDVLFVSIRAPGERVSLKPGHRDVITLEFDDWDPQRDGMGARRIVTPFSNVLAKKLKTWLGAYANAPERYRVLVHCQAGMSRSAAVAWWVHVTHGAILKTTTTTAYMNRFVLKILNSAIAAPDFPSDT
jgi:predicted protein tyrosine phosphatase